MELEVGAIVDGKVTGITKFGAFVALPGGRSGLVHISEVAYSYVSEVSEFLTVGQEVKVKIINVDENHRINLSIKQTLPPPPPRADHPGRGSRPGGNRDGRGNREGRGPRDQGGERSGNGGRDSRGGNRSGGGNRQERGTYHSSRPAASASKEPQSFDDMLKQFMSDSESKQSELSRGGERGGRGRRGGGGGRRGGGNSDYDF